MARQNGFLRAGVILLGYIAACYVAALALQLIIILTDADLRPELLKTWPGLFLSAGFIAPFIGFFAGIPAAFAIAIGETIPRRDWFYYTACGFGAGALLLGFFTLKAGIDPTGRDGVDLLFASIMLVGGTAAGLAYWAVAGRNAGAARTTSPAP